MHNKVRSQHIYSFLVETLDAPNPLYRIRTYEGTNWRIRRENQTDFSIIAEPVNGENTLNIQVSGKDVWDELNKKFSKHKKDISQITIIDLYNKYHSPFYLNKFLNLEDLYISGSGNLDFPDLSMLKKLTNISINRQSKAPNLTKLKTVPKLRTLEIGVFPPLSPLPLNNLDDIVQCKSLETLTFGNVKLSNLKLNKLSEMKHLKFLNLPQNVDVDTLAFLSTRLTNTKSGELKAWQKLRKPWNKNDIKINGKRRPYLSLANDQEKIKKYELQFNKLVQKYAV